jgi:hypothetical protein
VTDKPCINEKNEQYVSMPGEIDQVTPCPLSFVVDSGSPYHMVRQGNVLDTPNEYKGRVGVANADIMDGIYLAR